MPSAVRLWWQKSNAQRSLKAGSRTDTDADSQGVRGRGPGRGRGRGGRGRGRGRGDSSQRRLLNCYEQQGGINARAVVRLRINKKWATKVS